MGYSDSNDFINPKDFVNEQPFERVSNRQRQILKSVIDAENHYGKDLSKSPCPNLIATPSVNFSIYQS